MVNIERNGTVNSGSEPNENLLVNSHVHVDTESYNMHQWTYSTPPTDGETYTLQIKGKLGDGKAAWGIYNSGGSGGANSPRVIGTTSNSNYLTPNLYDETTGIYTAELLWQSGTPGNTFLRIYQMPNSVTAESEIEWIKLEKGVLPTPWVASDQDEDYLKYNTGFTEERNMVKIHDDYIETREIYEY